MAKEIVIKEKELNINIIIVAKKKGSKNDSNLRFFLRVWVASNLVIKICEEQAKIHLRKKFLLNKAFLDWIDFLTIVLVKLNRMEK